MCVAHFVRHSSSRSNAAVATPDVLSTLSTACEEGLRLTASRCGCGRLNPESTASTRTREVHLDLFLTYTVPKNKLLPSWSWTTLWAIEVDGNFYELCRDRGHPAAQNRYKLEQPNYGRTKANGTERAPHPCTSFANGNHSSER